MAAHSFLAEAASGVPSDVTAAIRDDKPGTRNAIKCIKHVFSSMSWLATRGLPSVRLKSKHFLSAGYKEKDILEIIHAIAS